MANVAGVTQLMETAVPATPSVASSAAPEQSFATAMHQANQDAGVPLAPVEPKGPAKPDDANAKADTTQKQALPEAPATDTQATAAKPNAVAAPPSAVRYTSANMLSAMLGAIVPASGDPIASVPATSSPVIPAIALIPSATPGDLPVQAAAPPTAGPVDPSPPVPPASLGVVPSAKLAAKGVASPTHASAPGTKGEPPKLAALAGTPVPVAAPVTVVAPTLPTLTAAIVPLPDTATPVADTDKSASKVANVAAGQGATASPSSGLISTAPIAQPGAATFQQSLAIQAQPATAILPQANTGVPAAAAAWPVTSAAAAPGNRPLPTHPDSIAAVGPQQAGATSVSNGAPAALPNAVATTTAPSAAIREGGQVQALVSQAQPQTSSQTSPVHKTFAKPALSVEASQGASGAPQAVLPSAAPPPATAESKTAPHPPAIAAAVPATTPAADASLAIATPVAAAHTPLAVTALSGSGGPALATSTTAATTFSDTTSTHATPGALQHTTLSSTPTTLEVGVASGTHGWLKIRAELNASGTVDASLTGANAAATGRLHNELPALSSFLQEERVALGSVNVAAPGAAVSALHAASTLEPISSFTRSAAEGVGATGAAVAGDAGASGERAPQQQAPESSPLATVLREDDAVAASVTSPAPPRYGEGNDLGMGGELSPSGYSGGGSRLNVRV